MTPRRLVEGQYPQIPPPAQPGPPRVGPPVRLAAARPGRPVAHPQGEPGGAAADAAGGGVPAEPALAAGRPRSPPATARAPDATADAAATVSAGQREASHGQAGRARTRPRQAADAQAEGDMPTRRVRPEGPDYGRGNPVQPPPYIPVAGPVPARPQDQARAVHPGASPGQALQRSTAYGVASAMLLIIMIVLAVLAPVLVAVLAIPVAVLLRAADLAQPELRAPTGAAALDVIRVFAFPEAWPNRRASRSPCSSTRSSLDCR